MSFAKFYVVRYGKMYSFCKFRLVGSERKCIFWHILVLENFALTEIRYIFAQINFRLTFEEQIEVFMVILWLMFLKLTLRAREAKIS